METLRNVGYLFIVSVGAQLAYVAALVLLAVPLAIVISVLMIPLRPLADAWQIEEWVGGVLLIPIILGWYIGAGLLLARLRGN